MLVGDGGRSYHRKQHKPKNRKPNNIQNEGRLQTRQERNRAKRLKKKQRHKKYISPETHAMKSNSNRSQFLYGNRLQNEDKKNTAQINYDPKIHQKNINQENENNTHMKIEIQRVQFLNQEELNAISAKMFRAKLMGNAALHLKLKQKLDNLRENAIIVEHRTETELENPSKMPFKKPSETKIFEIEQKFNKKTNKKTNKEIITDGKIVKQMIMTEIKDDDNIQTLLKKERNRTSKQYNNKINKNLNKLIFNSKEELFDTLNTQSLYSTIGNSRKRRREDKEVKLEQRKKAKLISKYKQNTEWLKNCKFCFENKEINDNYNEGILYIGKYLYILVPNYTWIHSKFELLIVPKLHLRSFREGIGNDGDIGCSKDEQNEFECELRNIQRLLCRFYKSLNCGCIFTEILCYIRMERTVHAIIEVFPVPMNDGLFDSCSIYFKKAILESDSVWNTNKKLIEVKLSVNGQNLRNSIPCSMAYFYVQFGMNLGFIHLIEDQSKFGKHFGREVIAGVLGEVLFRQKFHNFSDMKNRCQENMKAFEPFRVKYEQEMKENS